MPATIQELFDWEEVTSFTEPSLKLQYVVLNADTAAIVDTLVQGDGSGINPGVLQPLVMVGAGPLWYNNWKKTAMPGGAWAIEVNYGKDPPSSAGKRTVQVDTGGAMVHITQSLSTVQVWAVDASGNAIAAPDFKGAIGVTDQGVEGLDVPGTSYKITITVTYNVAEIPPDYIQVLTTLRGSMNQNQVSTSYKLQVWTYDAGELRFDDFHLSDPGTDLWEIAYTFNHSPNANNLGPFGQVPAAGYGPITKLGWDYLWFAYQPGTSNSRRTKTPYAAVVDRVSASIDFEKNFQGVFDSVVDQSGIAEDVVDIPNAD